jgi:ankyrin repeat protein
MHGAAYKNLPGVVEFLAAKGANIEIWNRRNKHGWTPLSIAEGHPHDRGGVSPGDEGCGCRG